MKKSGLIIFRIVSVLLLIFAAYLIYDWYKENEENKNVTDKLVTLSNITEDKSAEYPVLDLDFSALLSENMDTVGWIKVNNSNINYAVVQSDDNDYYLNHNFYRQKNSAGWIFADYRNDMRNLNFNTVIYGHNRRDNSMFSSLKQALNESWCANEENKYIYFNNLDTQMTWEVFSIYRVPAETYCTNTSFGSIQAYEEFLKTIKERSIYNYNVELYPTDKIITLYTCDNNNLDRIVLHAKLVYSR